jgi:small conductance mechanosensitive channel
MVPEWVAARDRVLAEMNQGTMPILRNFGIVLLVGYSAEILLRFLLRQSASRSAARAGHGLNSRALP